MTSNLPQNSRCRSEYGGIAGPNWPASSATAAGPAYRPTPAVTTSSSARRAGCGLRVSEIAGLRVDDVVVGVPRPYLRLRREVTKGGRPRTVPLWWDGETLAVLTEWLAERRDQGARGADPFICSVQAHRRGLRLQRAAVRRRFLTACRVLGQARARTLTIHHGRHTFVSHALAGGRSLAEVRAAAGHANGAVTSAYLHIVVDEEESLGQLFRYE